MTQIELCKECRKPESDIGHQEHPHNGSPISHYFQSSGKFVTLEEAARRKRIEEVTGNIRAMRWRIKDAKRALRNDEQELKQLRKGKK